MQVTVSLKAPHNRQRPFIESTAKRKVIRAGRRGGKTTGAAILAVEQFLKGRRVLYATPTQEQVGSFWAEVKQSLDEPLELGVFYKNESQHVIELSKTKQRIRAKTAWNADTLRGDYADLLILDEYQLMDADAWELVGAPMLLDNDGDAVFIYTKKRGKHHSDVLFKKAQDDDTGRWQTFVFSSHDNPHVSQSALVDITNDMTNLAYRMEIMAEDIKDDPGALWNREIIDRVTSHPGLLQIVVGVDPPGGQTECGIVVAGSARVEGKIHGYVLEDRSMKASPARWGSEAVAAYHRNEANWVAAEVNFGGDMVENTIKGIDSDKRVAFKEVRASRGKAIRAEPIVSYYEQGLVHHVGEFPELEDEMCNWVTDSGMPSPNRVDALVWALTVLMVGRVSRAKVVTVELPV